MSSSPPQPIHPSVSATLDPQYIEYHNKYVRDKVPNHLAPWSPSIRQVSGPSFGTSSPRPVGSTRDYRVKEFEVRVYTPQGATPDAGWPVMVWYHGGGCVLGGLASEASYLTQVCIGCSCVVVNVNYRHAPENPFPASPDDAVEALKWVTRDGPALLSIDPRRLVVGGLSSGGGLAAVVALTAPTLSPPIPILLQIMIVPVLDHSATAEEGGKWHPRANVPGLTPARMLWYRDLYLPDSRQRSDWRASPCVASPTLFAGAKATGAWIAVADHDILCDEGVAYGEQLKQAGYKVTTLVVKGATHAILLLDDAMDASRAMISASLAEIRQAFDSAP